jgi:hypothetical protein
MKFNQDEELEVKVIEETMKNTLINKCIGQNYEQDDSDSDEN